VSIASTTLKQHQLSLCLAKVCSGSLLRLKHFTKIDWVSSKVHCYGATKHSNAFVNAHPEISIRTNTSSAVHKGFVVFVKIEIRSSR